MVTRCTMESDNTLVTLNLVICDVDVPAIPHVDLD